MENSKQSAARPELLRILKLKSFLKGDFTLASGAKSKYYVDCRLTTLDAQGATLVGDVMWGLVREQCKSSGKQPVGIGGLTMGADPVALATAMASYRENPSRPLHAFTVRKAPKAHGQLKLIEGNFKSGDSVVVVDDVITTGDSTIKAIDAIQAAGGIVAFAAVLVDRQEGGRANIESRGIPVVAAFTRDELLAD